MDDNAKNQFLNQPTSEPSAKPIKITSNWPKLKKRLAELGMTRWGFLKSETRALPKILSEDEEIGGVVFGQSQPGSIMLIATDRRVVYLDIKPLYSHSEDITYDVVAGITKEWVGYHGTVILHTRLGDFKIRTLNDKAATIFREYVIKRCIEHQQGIERSTNATA